MSIILSSKWVDFLLKEKETGMGYYVVSVVLYDGRLFKKVIIADGKLTQIFGEKGIPFKEKDIKEIIITHDKWKFNP